MFTPCEVPSEELNEEGKLVKVYKCPYSDDPSGDTCRNCCGEGVDE